MICVMQQKTVLWKIQDGGKVKFKISAKCWQMVYSLIPFRFDWTVPLIPKFFVDFLNLLVMHRFLASFSVLLPL